MPGSIADNSSEECDRMYSSQSLLFLLLAPLAILSQLVFVSRAPAPEPPSREQVTVGKSLRSKSMLARRVAVHRQRRIIFNDDGGDLHHRDSSTPEGFLGVRPQRLIGTHVDTISWSITKGDAPTTIAGFSRSSATLTRSRNPTCAP